MELASCEFCDVVAGRRDGDAVFVRNMAAVGFVGAFRHPGHRAHLLVVASEHVADLHGLSARNAGPMLEAVTVASGALQATMGATGTTVVQHNGPPGQEVFHLHFHVVPRYEGDGGITSGWEPVDEGERSALGARLRSLVGGRSASDRPTP